MPSIWRGLRHNKRLLLPVADVLKEVDVVRRWVSRARLSIRLAGAGVARS
jgi:hypothetical protein